MATTKNKTEFETTERAIIIKRTFDAPRDVVWACWTEADRLKQWYAPAGWTVPHCTVDFRPGGRWHFLMKGPGGEESWGLGIYGEIDPKDRFVYEDSFSDKDGTRNDQMPICTVTMQFDERDGKTFVTSHGEYATAEELKSVLEMGVEGGVNEVWDRLEEVLRKA
jgi:uncharacterized protein YndB with AHSA1/START domain